MHDSAGNDLAAVTISLNNTHPPGFKHNVNVVMVGSPPPPQAQYDGECVDGTPMVLNIYTPVSQPPPFGTQLATWNVAFVVPQGYAFHATDPGSHLFSRGAQGDFK
jgi:hypothetical protein